MDLNLVRVFVAIYESRSVTAAAERLFVTQSAVSQSLSRMRREFADPLFERAGRSMQPTALADQVFPKLRDAVASVDSVMDDVAGFDPQATSRRFRIAMSALGETGWLPPIARQLATAAPLAQLEVLPLDADVLPLQLDRGLIDVAVTPSDLPSRYGRSTVKTQPYAVVMAAANPLATQSLDLPAYLQAHRAAVLGDSGAAIVADAEARAGVESGPAVAVQHFATVPALLLQRPDLLAVVPNSIAESWAAAGSLVVRPVPYPLDPIRIRVYRRATVSQPAALAWFSKLVYEAVAAAEAAGIAPRA